MNKQDGNIPGDDSILKHLDSGSVGLVNILKEKRVISVFCHFCIDTVKWHAFRSWSVI